LPSPYIASDFALSPPSLPSSAALSFSERTISLHRVLQSSFSPRTHTHTHTHTERERDSMPISMENVTFYQPISSARRFHSKSVYATHHRSNTSHSTDGTHGTGGTEHFSCQSGQKLYSSLHGPSKKLTHPLPQRPPCNSAPDSNATGSVRDNHQAPRKMSHTVPNQYRTELYSGGLGLDIHVSDEARSPGGPAGAGRAISEASPPPVSDQANCDPGKHFYYSYFKSNGRHMSASLTGTSFQRLILPSRLFWPRQMPR
jgi:hypothetical protein